MLIKDKLSIYSERFSVTLRQFRMRQVRDCLPYFRHFTRRNFEAVKDYGVVVVSLKGCDHRSSWLTWLTMLISTGSMIAILGLGFAAKVPQE
ncbi:hypothetical protein [Yoonia sp.]|uniref:hypothetical protein n=1 Tax=Yoonia sp. TaxID=2212373 RepID=UPI0028A01A64|nr:hypothetical protein [Yoonia sp.]